MREPIRGLLKTIKLHRAVLWGSEYLFFLNFVTCKRYKDNLRVIFDQWPKLHLGLDVLSNQKILKGVYVIFLGNLNANPGRMNNPIPMMELDRTENALRDILIKPLIIPDKNGLLQVPTKIGLGIEVDEIALEKYIIH